MAIPANIHLKTAFVNIHKLLTFLIYKKHDYYSQIEAWNIRSPMHGPLSLIVTNNSYY